MDNYPDPTENQFVKNILVSCKRTVKKPVVKKEPVTVQHLIQLCDSFRDSTDLLIVRNLCMITLSFAAFLRFDELSNIRCKDLVFHSNHVKIAIPRSKTDQYRFGSDVLVSKGTTSACPLSILKRCMDLANLTVQSESYLFKPIFRSKGI